MSVSPIEVREHGRSGPTLALLHGGPGAQGSVSSLAGTLAPHYRVLEPLQRRAGEVALTVLRHVEDLAVVAPERAAYVGWSWGAMRVLSFAALHPERVSTLVLVGCGSYTEETREAFSQALRKRLGRTDEARVADLKRRMDATEDAEWRDSLFGQMGAIIERAEAVDPTAFIGADVRADAAGHFETWDDVVRLQHEGVEPQRFSAITCPVLMLHGDDDPHPGTQIRDVLQSHIPQLAYIGIPDCGHVPWYERHGREPFLAALNEWIADTA